MNRSLRKICLRLGLLACSAVIIVILAAVLFLGVLPPKRTPIPIPHPNAYDEYVQAANQVVGDVGDTQQLDLVSLRTLVSSNAEPLRLAYDGLNHTCVLPTDQILTNFSTTFPFLSGSRRLAQLLGIQAQIREMEGHPEDAALIYAEMTRFGNEVSRGGVLVHRSSGTACESLGLRKLVQMVPTLDSEQARVVIAELEKVEAKRVSWHDIAEADNQLTHHLLRGVSPILWAKDWWENRGLLRSSEAHHNLALAHSRLVLLELALRCYRSDHGEPPAQLGQLAPTYLKRIPSDPFSSAPLIYRPQGTNWLLYSVGFDKVDEGGKPASRSVNSTGDVFYDSSW